MKKFYSIDDIATITMLSTRTIRNYLRQGFIEGEKIDGAWQFTMDAVDDFLKNDYVNQSVQTKRNGLVYDYLLNNTKAINSVCSIYDYPVKDNIEAEEIYNNIIKKVNSNEYGDIKFSYNYQNKMVRIVLIGEAQQIMRLMQD